MFEKKGEVLPRRVFLRNSTLVCIALSLNCSGEREKEKKEYSNFLSYIIDEIKNNDAFKIDKKIDSEEWARAVLNTLEKNNFDLFSKDIDSQDENLLAGDLKKKSAMVLAIILRESSFSERKDFDGKTLGSMQVNYEYAKEEESKKEEGLNENDLKKYLETKEGGVFYGVKYLAKIAEIYKDLEDEELKLKCIFADYNAGAFASRNASIQKFLNDKHNAGLKIDGLIGEKTKEKLKEFLLDNGITEEEYNSDFKFGALSSIDLVNTKSWKKMQDLNNGLLLPVVPETTIKTKGVKGLARRIFGAEESSREYSDKIFYYYSKILEIVNKHTKD